MEFALDNYGINTSSLRMKTKDVFGPVLAAMHHDMTVVSLPEHSEAEAS